MFEIAKVIFSVNVHLKINNLHCKASLVKRLNLEKRPF